MIRTGLCSALQRFCERMFCKDLLLYMGSGASRQKLIRTLFWRHAQSYLCQPAQDHDHLKDTVVRERRTGAAGFGSYHGSGVYGP